ncbi:MAG: hypothetical protein D6770_02175 [Anaerolineae bacterium]|nr:MAG: hypothetical protein D6770_02175 [Anaerolineae bacterium]
MAELYRFLSTYEGVIYFVLALGGLFALRWLWSSWREWQEAVFGLEREFARRRLARALAAVVIILLLGLGEFAVASFVIPSLPASVFLFTPTVQLLTTPQGTLSPDLATPPAQTPLPTTPAEETGCVSGKLAFTSPRNGDEVSGIVVLEGTVDIPRFGFYKYEVAPHGSDLWAAVSAGRLVVREGELGRWDTTELAPGDYDLRLVAVDNEGNALPPCVITVRVKGE